MLLQPPTGDPAERMLVLDEGERLRTTIAEQAGSPTGSIWTNLSGATTDATPTLAHDSPSRASNASLDSLSPAFWNDSPSVRYGDNGEVDSSPQYRQFPRSSPSAQNATFPNPLSLPLRPSPRQSQDPGSLKTKKE